MKTFVPALVVFLVSATVGAEPLSHIVREGDTVYGIARRFEVDMDELLRFNGIEAPELLLPGTVILIPGEDEEIPLTTYTVTAGDTLYRIAREYEITVDELRTMNDLDQTDVLRIGLQIVVPVKEHPSDPPENDVMPTILPVTGSIAERIPFDGTSTWPVDGETQRLEGKLPGIMIYAEPGSPVRAVASGRVVYSGPHTSFGNVVFVQSGGGYIYVYGGQGSVDVNVGEAIEAGTRIGSTGILSGDSIPALYFSVWRNNEFIDPERAPRG